MRPHSRIALLVTDLDNTLYDWFAFFVPSIYTMIDKASEILQVPKESLVRELRAVHQAHHDVEHPFALLETEVVKTLARRCSQARVAECLDPAFYEFNKARLRHLKLYPGVARTLARLRSRGLILVAYSESKKHAVMGRLNRLGLTDMFDRIYCRKASRSLHPNPMRARSISESYPADRVIEHPRESKKPDPDLLAEICRREGFAPEQTAYVGDSLTKDVLMANRAGVLAIWARYGQVSKRDDYEKLVAISHWTEDDVARERQLSREIKEATPDFVLRRRFSEVQKIVLGPWWWMKAGRREATPQRAQLGTTGLSRDLGKQAAGESG